MKNFNNLKKIFISICIGIFIPEIVKAEGSPIYYDSFYEDYYKAFPDTKPKKTAKKVNTKNQTQQPVYYDPYMQQQFNMTYNQNITPFNSYYNQSVIHNLKEWEIDIQYRKTYGQFMFETDVGSLLNWDEMDSTETIFKVSRDFMIKNRQYVFSATYGTGSGTTTRTSDDDIFNEAHIISLGAGDVDLSNWSIGLGMRNLWKIGNWDVTPFIGYKQRKQDFQMFDHATPSPFYLDYFCTSDNGGIFTASDGQVYEGVCTDGIDLLSHVNDLTYWQDVMYYMDPETGDIYDNIVEEADMFIPGAYDDGEFYAINLSVGDQIYEEDYCYYSEQGNFVCISAGEGGINLLEAFGGVSSVWLQEGVTHMYFVDWSGPYFALNFERKISNKEDLTFYAEYFLPHYKVWGNWPNRVDWMHDPSFVDEGGSGMGLFFDFNYKYNFRKNMQFTVGANFEYLKNKNADTTLYFSDGEIGFYPASVMLTRWKAFGINAGISFKF